jgi:aspartate racemase
MGRASRKIKGFPAFYRRPIRCGDEHPEYRLHRQEAGAVEVSAADVVHAADLRGAIIGNMAKGLHLGLIGGIGPAATVVYYQRLCAAMRTRGARLELTIVQADIHELIANNLADRREEQSRIYASLIQRLKAAGADLGAITSLGGHFCFEETKAVSVLPLVSAVTPLDDYFAAEGIGCIGLLGTRVVMRTRLYGQLVKTRALALDDQIDDIGQAYQDVAVSGLCPEATRQMFFAAGRRMAAEGAEAIVLAGTDLNLAFDGQEPGFRVIDALDVHVALLADLASGLREL